MKQHPADAAGHGRGYLESRIATQDGYIWPFERARMVSAGAIGERMVEDIRALVFDGGEDAVVSLADLLSKGWTSEQIRAHGQPAFCRFNEEREKDEASGVYAFGRDTLGRQFVEAASLGIFCFGLLTWAGIGGGSL
ncbi:hypothetical protein [Bosea sp. BK604]|uniref:hypothetical protein n=1 Tax=Bosea sp. BK604 TaxID=2512180 RepID=UPI001046E239|nr:hypothetical protein [Bosea sp. BK604]TCR69716.1 hypothetical protein EV560_101113 [Bosea sp. BK604]